MKRGVSPTLAKRVRSAAVAPFVPVRRSVRYLPTGMLAAFVSNDSQVGNFLPDESDKVSGRGSKIPATVYGIYTPNRQTLPCSAKDARNPARLAQIGRPLFKAWYEACSMLKLPIPFGEMLELAADKLLGGAGKNGAWEDAWKKWEKFVVPGKIRPSEPAIQSVPAGIRPSQPVISDAAAVAAAGFRLSLAINPICKLAQKVSRAHMVSVVGVSDCRRYVRTGWFMEPLLAEAAARIMRAGQWRGMCAIISVVRKAIMHHWVDVGYVGELAGRLLLLRAMDMSRDVPGNEFPKCSLDEFIHNLAGQSLSNFCGGVEKDAELQRLLNGVVSFNFWFVDDCVHLTPEMLLEAFLANAALVCQERTWGIDLVVPVYLGSLDGEDDIKVEDMTTIFVQVRNRKGSYSFEATPMHARVSGWTKRPFLSLYINVSRDSTGESMVFETGAEMKRKVLGTASSRISRGKLKALIDFHPESVAARESGTAAGRKAFKITDSEIDNLDKVEQEELLQNRNINADIYNAWAGWFQTCHLQYGLIIPAPLGYVEKTEENEVAADLLDQVYELAQVAGPDRRVMCAQDFRQQMDFGRQRRFQSGAVTSVKEEVEVADDSIG